VIGRADEIFLKIWQIREAMLMQSIAINESTGDENSLRDSLSLLTNTSN
jgi:hypothetical protein